jgi:hypothetical protein
LLPSLVARTNDSREVVEHVTIAKIEHKQTPRPTPTPPPRHTLVVAQAHAEGKAAHAEIIKRMGAPRPKPPHLHSKPIWDVAPFPTAGQGAGAGKGTDAGSIGNGTNGTGAGTQGSGAGGGGAPCGAVDFSTKGLATLNPTTGFYERSNIVATVHYADGTSETIPLDWTWHFKSEDLDPFQSDVPLFFQFPPAAQRASEPAAVQWIMKNSRPYGGTDLNDQCPNIPPPPTPHASSNFL